MNRDEKIDYARRYCRGLVERHPAICGIVLGGSLARGNDLPVSDIDLWCFVDRDAHPLPIEKHPEQGVYIDIEQYVLETLTSPEMENDCYVFGYLLDAVILFDRDGLVADCQAKARSAFASPQFSAAQLAAIRRSVVRNCRNFASSLEARDPCEACRTSIFAVWSLCDHMLVAKGVPPGGARGMARLRGIWPEAAAALANFEGSSELGPSQIQRLLATCRGVTGDSSFFRMWLEKVEWMFANRHEADALHALWIALGLRVKDAKGRCDAAFQERLGRACGEWLTLIGWDWAVAERRLADLRGLIAAFCPPDSAERRTEDVPGTDTNKLPR